MQIHPSKGGGSAVRLPTAVWPREEKLLSLFQLRYFTGTAANLPGSRFLYWVGEQSGAQPHCLTCSNPACSFSRATVAPAATAYMLDCLGPAPPTSRVVSLPANQEILSLDTNSRLVETLHTVALPQVLQYSV